MKSKIVRDLIPKIISNSGKIPVTTKVSVDEAVFGLEEKLSEELAEYLEDHSLEELADLVEVIHGILYHRGYTWSDLEQVRINKRAERGGFEDRILLTDIIQKTESGE